jgi:DNA-directed RNA polymerase subunit RPC12/RpoP
MSEFKFNCPKCGQHILANEEWGDRQIDCPSCNTRITIPPTTKVPKKQAPAVVPAPKVRQRLPGMDVPAKAGGAVSTPAPRAPVSGKESPAAATSPARTPTKNVPPAVAPKPTDSKTSGGEPQVESPARRAEATPAPGTPTSSAPKEGRVEKAAATAAGTKPGAAAAPKPVEPPRVAVLSPGVKLAMVRGVRRRIADESAWLPGKVKDSPAYAGKMQNGELVLLDARSPEATRFSLIGAFLLEMHERRVVRTAIGRKRFLDEEIPEAIRELLLEHMSDEERERSEDPLAGQDLLSISHAQCLAVLDALEARYSQRMEQRQIESAKRRLGNMRLPELVKKLEKKVGISPEEVATALYHEVMDLRRHLERMEGQLDRKKPLRADERE